MRWICLLPILHLLFLRGLLLPVATGWICWINEIPYSVKSRLNNNSRLSKKTFIGKDDNLGVGSFETFLSPSIKVSIPSLLFRIMSKEAYKSLLFSSENTAELLIFPLVPNKGSMVSGSEVIWVKELAQLRKSCTRMLSTPLKSADFSVCSCPPFVFMQPNSK